MTASVNELGQIVLRPGANEKLGVKPGDILIVKAAGSGRVVLQRRSSKPAKKSERLKAYLSPPLLASAELTRIYTMPDEDWDRVEAAGAQASRRALKGHTLDEL